MGLKRIELTNQLNTFAQEFIIQYIIPHKEEFDKENSQAQYQISLLFELFFDLHPELKQYAATLIGIVTKLILNPDIHISQNKLNPVDTSRIFNIITQIQAPLSRKISKQ